MYMINRDKVYQTSMTRVRQPDRVARTIARDKPMKCLHQRFQSAKFVVGSRGFTYRHYIRTSWLKRCAAVPWVISEQDHV
jgi:hypothetical protein